MGAVGLALRALEVPVSLDERLGGEVLGVVMIAGAVVRVVVDVAQVLAVEVRELAVELGLAASPAGGRIPWKPMASRSVLRRGSAIDALRRPSTGARAARSSTH